MGAHDNEECPAVMRGRHDNELKSLKEGQDRMDLSVKDLTATIKEYVVLTQELQTTRIAALEKRHDVMEKRQDSQDMHIEQLGKDYVSVRSKANFTYKAVLAASGALIVGMIGTIFGFLWSNAMQQIQPEKVKSCTELLQSFC